MERSSKSGSSGSRRPAGSFTIAVLWCLLAGLVAIAGAQNDDAPSASELADSLLLNPLIDDEGNVTETLTLPGGDGDFSFWKAGDNILDSTEPPPMCVAHGLSRAGQGAYMSGSGAYMSGSVGGLVLGPIVIQNSGEVVPSFPVSDFAKGTIESGNNGKSYYNSADTDTLMDLLTPSMGNGDVVILVADDFAGDIFKVPEGLFSLTELEVEDLRIAYESANPNGPLPPESRRLRAVLEEYPVSHGALVLHHLNALIAATWAFQLDEMTSSDEVYYWTHRNTGSKLVVQALDLLAATQNGGRSQESLVETQDIVNALSSAVYREPVHPQATTVIVNMSWVLLPCATVQAFIAAQNQFENMDAYLDALESENPSTALGTGGESFEHDALQFLTYVSEFDPLYGSIRAFDARGLFVAASGNFGMPYQMSPASWYTVLGVGAPKDWVTGEAKPPPPYSNASEVSAPGAWFSLESFMGQSGEPDPNAVNLSYAGTSFSSPLIAFFHAVDAATSGDCIDDQGSGGLVFSRLARSVLSEDRPVRQGQPSSSNPCPVE